MMDRTKWNQRTPTSWIAVTALLVFACFWVACGGGAGSANTSQWEKAITPPKLTGVSLTSGPTTGGATVAITGTDFQAGATVTFGGLTAAVINLTSTSIAVTTPAHAAGPVDVTVTNPDLQSATLPAGYAYVTPGPAPTISTTLLPGGDFLVAYSTNLAGSGGTPPYTWSVVPGSGNLPPGVTLDAATGALSGTPVQIGTFNFTIQLTDAASQTATQALSTDITRPGFDQYGGLTGLPSPNPPTGFFRLEKIGSRWTLVDPLGNAFWFLGVALVNTGVPGSDPASATKYGTYVQAKYGSNTNLWASQIKLRMLSWGFNSIGVYESNYLDSYGAYGRAPNPPLMPHFNLHVRFATDSMRNYNSLIANPVKNIRSGTQYGKVFPDVFDPGFATYANAAMAQNTNGVNGGVATEVSAPWVIGYIPDELDTLAGFGAGHAHLAHIALISNPSMTSFTVGSSTRTTTDPVNYTKKALRDFLATRYSNNINTLNAAWGSSYTTLDSAGGWVAYPGTTGTGLMDENGSSAWLGDPVTLAGETTAMKKDMDDFLIQIATMYFKTVHDAIRAVDSNHLIFSPVSLSSDTQRAVLATAGPYLDAFIALPTHLSDTSLQPTPGSDIYDLTGKPILVGSLFMSANPDSSLSSLAQGSPGYGYVYYDTQQDRAWAYATWLNNLVSLQGADGSKCILGFQWWSLVDNSAEKRAYGLLTYRDNAYDGVEARIAAGTDPWGYPVGGEVGNYGDMLTLMRNANLYTYQTVASGN